MTRDHDAGIGQRRPPATRILAEWAASVRYDDIPPDVVQRAKEHTLNIIACALRGQSLESAEIVYRVHSLMGGSPDATLIGRNGRTSVAAAAGVNAHFAYCTMNDDTFFEATLHPGHAGIPAALAVAEREERSGEEFLRAVVIGFEVGCRVGASLCQSQESHKARLGWHCNISDAFVAMGAAGALLHLDADQFVAGLGIAATSSSGLVETMNPPPSYVWPWDGGMNTYLAVLGAYFAREGMTAGETALEGPQGYITMFTGGKAPDEAFLRATRGLGSEWSTREIQIKTRSASFMMHCPIDAAQRVVVENDIPLDEIKSITIRTNHWTSGRLMYGDISDYNSTLFSLSYAIAVALQERTLFTLPDQNAKYLGDATTKKLMALVHAELDPELDRVFGAHMPAIARVETLDGRSYECRVDVPKGKFPEEPLSEQEILHKVRSNAAHVLSAEDIEDLISEVSKLEHARSMSGIVKLIRG